MEDNIICQLKSTNVIKKNVKIIEGLAVLKLTRRKKKHLARLEHFAKRKEEGKSYVYVPPVDAKEKAKRAKKNVDRRLPIAQLDSLFGKLEYQLNQEKIKAKEAAFRKKGRYNKDKKEKVSE